MFFLISPANVRMSAPSAKTVVKNMINREYFFIPSSSDNVLEFGYRKLMPVDDRLF
jgi:hypothetical protein